MRERNSVTSLITMFALLFVSDMSNAQVQAALERHPETISRPRVSEPGNEQTVTVKNMTFSLHWCRLSGETIKCQFRVVNQSTKDQRLILSWNSQIVDENGVVYKVSKSEISGGRRLAGGRGSSATLVPDTPVQATLEFANFKSETEKGKLALLRISFSASGPGSADFTDIPVGK